MMGVSLLVGEDISEINIIYHGIAMGVLLQS